MRHVPIDFEVHEIGSHRVMQQSRYAHVKSRHRQISTFRKSSSMPHVQHSERWPNVLVTSLLQIIFRFMLDRYVKYTTVVWWRDFQLSWCSHKNHR